MKQFIFLLSSPFNRRKWLPPPLRKLSQGKVDKTASGTSSTASIVERPLMKKGSEKTFKLPIPEQQHKAIGRLRDKSTSDQNQKGESSDQLSSHSNQQADLEPEDDTFELPPPMKPIQDSQTMQKPTSAYGVNDKFNNKNLLCYSNNNNKYLVYFVCFMNRMQTYLHHQPLNKVHASG